MRTSEEQEEMMALTYQVHSLPSLVIIDKLYDISGEEI
jgi:hypothetical protein